jgi:hypothetical protein
MLRTSVLALAFAVFALALAGCGNKEDFTTVAETEGVYLDVGGLVYQVQLSRFLNPGDVEDKEYLTGLAEGVDPQLPGDEIWFGVWMRVKNYSKQTLRPTSTFTIVDTEENKYEPVAIDGTINPFVYEPTPLGPAQVLPLPDTAAASGPIQGSLILFRLKTDTLPNRPLKLEIEQGGSEPAEVDLDL